jgi:hypothetical protein
MDRCSTPLPPLDLRHSHQTEDEDDEDSETQGSTCCGIRWKHLILLFLFIGPTVLTVFFTGSDLVMKYTGLQMPSWIRAEPPNPYRTRLMAFYRKTNPSKLGKSLTLSATRFALDAPSVCCLGKNKPTRTGAGVPPLS